MVAVINTPRLATGFPVASEIWMTGCGLSATPAAAVLDGEVVITSRAATGAVMVGVVEQEIPPQRQTIPQATVLPRYR
jgi:hypothetical protein